MAEGPDNWTDWFDQHAAAMLLLARQRVPTRADAEDVVQDAFVRFWPRRAEVSDARAYLYCCVRHCAADLLRANGRRQARERAAAIPPAASNGQLFVRDPETAERQVRVEAAIRQLPTEQREVVVLKIWAGLTFTQIGTVLEASANTVASRYRYALRSLRITIPEEVMS